MLPTLLKLQGVTVLVDGQTREVYMLKSLGSTNRGIDKAMGARSGTAKRKLDWLAVRMQRSALEQGVFLSGSYVELVREGRENWLPASA